MEAKEMLENAEVVEETPLVKQEEISPVEEEVIPDFNSPQWHEYVMKQFAPDEIVEGNPTTEGLRRVVSLLLGDIIESSAKCVSAPTKENNYSATVEHKVVINWCRESEGYGGGDIRTFTEIADVTDRNSDETVFRAYPTATASTRAEGRALRKALKLKHIVAAEEVEQSNESEPEDKKISTNQVVMVKHLAKRNGIDVFKFINSGTLQYSSIEDVSYNTAHKMLAKLNEYLNDKNKIPSKILLKKEKQ
ncbi:MAG: hypothetical protein K2X69_00295 [Silvanigrellaceae bacterium]|nr:hypothetical protein [Silvanigrellaceae bacterium]